MSRYDWMENAACAQTDPDLFHVDGSGTAYGRAKKVCASCPVQLQCEAHSLNIEGDASKRERHGLWAGQTPRQRLAHSGHQSRRETHEIILRLHARGGMNAREIAETAGCDERTVYRVTARLRDQLGEAA